MNLNLSKILLGAGVVALSLSPNFVLAQVYYGQTSYVPYPYLPAPSTPSVQTPNSSDVNASEASLFGSVNPNGSQTTIWFEYGTNGSYGQRSNSENIGAGNVAVNVFSRITNLSPNTTYYYRLAAQSNYGGIQYNSSGRTFTTRNNSNTSGNGVLRIETKPAIEIGTNRAVVKGIAYPEGNNITAWFSYGTTNAMTSISPSRTFDSTNTSAEMTLTMTALRPGTTYYYRFLATGPNGEVQGRTLSFRTKGTAPSNTSSEGNNNSQSGGTNTNTPGTSGGTRTNFPEPPIRIPGFGSGSRDDSSSNTSSTASSTASNNQSGNVMLTAAADKSSLKSGDELDFTLTYRSTKAGEMRNVNLSATLPDGLEFVVANIPPTIENNKLLFSPGNLASGGEGKVIVKLKAKETISTDQDVLLSSNLMFSDEKNVLHSANADLSVKLVRSTGSAWASMFSTFQGVKILRWVFGVLFAVLVFGVLYIIYRYFKSKSIIRSSI